MREALAVKATGLSAECYPSSQSTINRCCVQSCLAQSSRVLCILASLCVGSSVRVCVCVSVRARLLLFHRGPFPLDWL